MAQKVTVLLLDDLDESQAVETVVFGLDGSTYEIDLSQEHADQLRSVFARYVEAGRRAGRPPAGRGKRAGSTFTSSSSTTSRARSASSSRRQEIREWARANGHQVGDRGRLSEAVVQAFEAATP